MKMFCIMDQHWEVLVRLQTQHRQRWGERPLWHDWCLSWKRRLYETGDTTITKAKCRRLIRLVTPVPARRSKGTRTNRVIKLQEDTSLTQRANGCSNAHSQAHQQLPGFHSCSFTQFSLQNICFWWQPTVLTSAHPSFYMFSESA